jgi:hypothetical protein
MFNIFPTMTILDTLDRAGKDAYASTSMTLNASRVPDALFEKDNPRPASAFPNGSSIFNNFSAPSILSNVPGQVSSMFTNLPQFHQMANGLGAVNKKKRRKSQKLSGTSATNNKSSKRGKTGKLSKISTIGKGSSLSTRSSLLFPVGRIKRKLK